MVFQRYFSGVSACTCVVFQRVPQWCFSVYLCGVSVCTCVVFQAAEHVLGSVLCAPGCFSVYLCSVLACTSVVFQRVSVWCFSVYLCGVSGGGARAGVGAVCAGLFQRVSV